MKPDKIASLREWLRVARAFDHIAESVARDFNDSLDALAERPALVARVAAAEGRAAEAERLKEVWRSASFNNERFAMDYKSALEAAARSLEWIASNGIDDEDPRSLRAYTRNRAMVARTALAGPQEGPK